MSGWRVITKEEDMRPRLEVRPPLGPEGTGTAGWGRQGGEMVREMAEEGRNLEGITHRVLQGR